MPHRQPASIALSAGLSVVLLALAALAHAGDLARVIPADAAIYVGWAPCHAPDSPELRAAQEAWKAMSSYLASDAAPPDPAFTTARAILNVLPLLAAGAGGLAVFDVTIEDGRADVQAALVIECTADAPRLAETVHNIVTAFHGPDSVSQHAVKDLTLECVPLDGSPMSLAWGVCENYFLLALGDTAAGKIIDGLHGQTPVLADAAEFVFDRQKVQTSAGREHFCAYVDFQRVLNRAKEIVTETGTALPPIADAAPQALGLTALRSAYLHVDGAAPDAQHAAFVHLDGPRCGLLKVWEQQPLADEDLKIVPKDAYWAAVDNLNLAGLWAETLRVLDELIPEQVPLIESALTMSKTMIGFSVTDDLLPALGDTWAIFDAPDHGGLLLSGTVLVAEMRNQEEFERVLGQLVRFGTLLASGNNIKILSKQVRHGEHEIQYLLFGGLPVPVAPAWGFANQHWVLGLSPQTVAAALRQVDPKTRGESLLDQPHFRAARGRLPAQAHGLAYCDSQYFTRLWYPLATGLQTLGVSLLANHGLEIDFQPMPPLPEAAAQVRNLVGTTSTDQDGTMYAWVGEANPVLAAAASTGLATGILLPSLARAREVARRAASADHLRDIGRACERFAVEHADDYPAALDQLLSDGSLTGGQLHSPRDHAPGAVSYAYVTGQNRGSDTRNILAYEKPYDREGTNALFLDGRVEWLDLEEFELLLRATYERLGRRDELPEGFPLPVPD